jgi:hypothetical protein
MALASEATPHGQVDDLVSKFGDRFSDIGRPHFFGVISHARNMGCRPARVIGRRRSVSSLIV